MEPFAAALKLIQEGGPWAIVVILGGIVAYLFRRSESAHLAHAADIAALNKEIQATLRESFQASADLHKVAADSAKQNAALLEMALKKGSP